MEAQLMTASGRVADTRNDTVTVRDDRHVRWSISERDAADVPGARGPRCLVFMSESTVRRIWTYPASWRRLSPDALLALSER
jgi:hypothetical protein